MYSDMSTRSSARLVVEQKAGERLGQLGLAHPGRAEEDERADRPVRILQAGTGTANGTRYRLDGIALADDPFRQFVFHPQQLVAFAFQHLVDRDTGPTRNHMGDVVGGDDLLHHRIGVGVLLAFGVGKLFLELGDDAIGQLAGALELTLALDDRQFVTGFIELLLKVGGAAKLLLFRLPTGRQRRCLLFESRPDRARASPAGPSTRCRFPSSALRARSSAA